MATSTGTGGVRILNTSVQGCPTAFLLYNFDIGGHTLKPSHRGFIRQRIHRILSNDQRTRMRLVGRSSRSGPDTYNLRLSGRRVDAVIRLAMGLGGVARGQIDSQSLGERQPFSPLPESEDDRSVEVHFTIPTQFILSLENVTVVRHWRIIEATIRHTLGPLVQRAGRSLMLGRRIPADIVLTFDRGGRESRPCQMLILGNEGGGDIFVGAHRDLRVCGVPQLNRRTGHVDHGSQMQRVFEDDQPQFARFVANTAIHEMGHVMGLSHVADRSNFMFSDGSSGANLPRAQRTLQTMRRHWAGAKRFNPAQKQRIICALQTGFYPGGLTVQSGP